MARAQPSRCARVVSSQGAAIASMTMRLQSKERTVRAVDVLLAQMHAGDAERTALQARARAYSRECGCAMGAIFLTAALALTLIYFATTGDLRVGTGIACVMLVFFASMLGKMTGLVLARAKLALLRWSLARRLQRMSSTHVYMH
jgi:hypothetical protein